MTKFLRLMLVCGVFLTWHQVAPAGEVTTLNGTQNYAPNDVTGSGSVAITTTNARSGDGSLEFTTTGPNDKATVYGFGATPTNPTGSLGTLGALVNGGALSYDIHRDPSSTSPDYVFPSFKLSIRTADGSGSASLLYEPVYNGSPVVSPLSSGVWQTLDILNANFYERDHSTNRENSSTTLADYLNGYTTTKNNPTSTPKFNGSSVITGIEIGVGSGIGGTFHSFADNVRITFAGGQDFNSNFEVAVATPEPSTLVSGAIGSLVGLVWLRRPRRSKVA